jgi:hypothetical protein
LGLEFFKVLVNFPQNQEEKFPFEKDVVADKEQGAVEHPVPREHSALDQIDADFKEAEPRVVLAFCFEFLAESD